MVEKCLFVVVYLQLAHKKKVLGEVSISLLDHGDVKLKEIKDNTALTFLCSDVELTKCVSVHTGIMSDTMMLINAGDFVQYSDGLTEVKKSCASVIL